MVFEVLRADPCRFVKTLFDYHSLRRIWRAWWWRGTNAILAEISTSQEVPPQVFSPYQPPAIDRKHTHALLVIDASIPQYDRDAGARSSFLYLQILREMGHKVFFMPNDQLRREPYASMLESLGVQLLIGRGFRCGQWKQWLSNQAGQISHIILHRPNVAKQYLASIKKRCNTKIIYFAHDLRFIREERQFEVNGDFFHYKEAIYWEKVERRIISQVNLAYFFSNEEARLVSEWGLSCILRSIPLFPVDLSSCLSQSFDQRAGLLFVGGFSHQPNLDAVLWFARKIFPLVRKVLPDIKWNIVGRDPPPEVRNLAGSGIIVEGAVSEHRLETLYQTTKVVIAPLRFGAGVKGKVVEAMCRSIPVVTTPVGAEGILDAEKALCITHSPEEMAKNVIALCQDRIMWQNTCDQLTKITMLRFSRMAAIHRLSTDLFSVVS